MIKANSYELGPTFISLEEDFVSGATRRNPNLLFEHTNSWDSKRIL
jgi:hypothetical protein